MSVDVRGLRAFALVADLGSVSAAAGVLGYTQAAVSQQLAALEREVGTALLDRSQRPLRPTPAGERLRPRVLRALAELGGVEAAVEDLRAGAPRIRLAAFPSALSSFVPAAVRDMRRAHPEAVVQTLHLETVEAVEALRSGAADIAVVHHMPGIAGPQTAGLRRRRLGTDHLYVLLPEWHRLARRERLALADLEGEFFSLPPRDSPAGRFRALLEHLCAQAGFAPRVAYENDYLPTAKAFVAAGLTVAVMHGLTLIPVPPGTVVRPLAESPAGSRSIEALASSPAGTPMVDHLVERLAAAARSVRSGPT